MVGQCVCGVGENYKHYTMLLGFIYNKRTPHHIGGVQTPKAVAALRVVGVLVGHSRARILARRRNGSRSDVLTQAEHVAVVGTGKRHGLGEIRKIVDITRSRGIRGRNGELARNLGTCWTLLENSEE